MKTRIMSVVLTVVMLLALVPISAFAAETDVLASAKSWQETFKAEYDAKDVSWDTLITAIYYYQEAVKAKKDVSELKTYYETQVTELDMSGKSESKYAITTGALVEFKGLKKLNLSNTGISNLGGLVGLTALEELDVSKNAKIGNSVFGAIYKLPLKKLNLAGTSISEFAPLTKHDAGSVYNTLEELNISETEVIDFNALWKPTEYSMPALKKLIAQKLDIKSLAGLVEVVNNNPSITLDVDITNSLFPDGTENAQHIGRLFTVAGRNKNFKITDPVHARVINIDFDVTPSDAVIKVYDDGVEKSPEADGSYMLSKGPKTDYCVVSKYGYDSRRIDINASFDPDMEVVLNKILNDVTVENGTASSDDAALGDIITIDADDIIGGKQFIYWEITREDGEPIEFVSGGKTTEIAQIRMPLCDVTIKAVYRAVLPMFMHSIIVVDSDYGTTSPTGIMLVMQGLSHKFTFTPDAGCEIVDVLINGESVGAVDSYRLTVNEFVNTVEAIYAPVLDGDAE